MLEKWKEMHTQALTRAPITEPLRRAGWQALATIPLPEALKDHPIGTDCRITSSPAPWTIKPLEDALKSYGPLLFADTSKERSATALLNQALFSTGLFLYLPADMRLDKVLDIHIDGSQDSLSLPRLHLVMGQGSHLNLHITSTGDTMASHLQATLEEGASLTLLDTTTAKTYFATHRFTLHKQASLRWLSPFAHGPIEHDLQADLVGEEAYVDLRAYAQLRGGAKTRLQFCVKHSAPNTRANQTVKHILYDHAKAHFEGKIFVGPLAQKTESYQLNKNLILGTLATATSRPCLEIFTDDVKASHGATTGQLNPDELFYLQGRGIAKSDAELFLIRGFIADLLEGLPEEMQRLTMDITYGRRT